MNLIGLRDSQTITDDLKLSKQYAQFEALLDEIRKKELPQSMTDYINESVGQLNASSLAGDAFRKLLKKTQTEILKKLEKELKIVPRNYYRTMWMVLGMSTFGLPIGVAFGLGMGNLGLLGIGLPIGMGIGLLAGSSMDKKAFNEGRQLNIEIKQ